MIKRGENVRGCEGADCGQAGPVYVVGGLCGLALKKKSQNQPSGLGTASRRAQARAKGYIRNEEQT